MSRKKSTKVAKLAVDTFSKTLEALESIFKIGPDAFGLFQGKPFEYWEAKPHSKSISRIGYS